ncbi:peptide deformylase [Aestuariicoccus sp. MJ-SS9]|uniref:peptide deformylase n=1 Tax=Aestuariicoccus sp. MJ-SS9 TaxID=3079855 RepID=UPI002913E4E3|nr:peptide deformylase [Aestuariicoccus sp. MJ-SS9]MDU8912748.1 peptide deformylase [Aestuariicoccus sp. MJ-SS9]
MSVRPILEWPDPHLSRRCEPVASLDGIEALVGDLFETMYAAAGRGLAAPQVGVLARVFVIDVGWKEGDMRPLACLNPRIAEASDDIRIGPEQCLSIPGVTAQVPRHRAITLAFTDLNGAMQQRRLTGAEAICAQHELDHLDGLVHFDRLSAEGRAQLVAEYEGRL